MGKISLLRRRKRNEKDLREQGVNEKELNLLLGGPVLACIKSPAKKESSKKSAPQK